MERPSLACGLAVRALRPTGHRQAGALGRGRDAKTTIGRGYLSQVHSPSPANEVKLILVRFQDEPNNPGPSGQASQRLGIFRHPREASFKLTEDCLH